MYPTSAEVSRYVAPTAWTMSAQPLPFAAQRCHLYAYPLGAFAQEPSEEERSASCPAVPLTTGGATVVGATLGV